MVVLSGSAWLPVLPDECDDNPNGPGEETVEDSTQEAVPTEGMLQWGIQEIIFFSVLRQCFRRIWVRLTPFYGPPFLSVVNFQQMHVGRQEQSPPLPT